MAFDLIDILPAAQYIIIRKLCLFDNDISSYKCLFGILVSFYLAVALGIINPRFLKNSLQMFLHYVFTWAHTRFRDFVFVQVGT